MSENAVKISIIIPIYNDELYLSDLLQSVENQTFTDFECLCINDGSIDKTETIIDKFCAKDSRFIKINRENGGVSAARNTGLDAARGEYIFFIDHDDLVPNYTLQNLLDAAEKYGADMARGRMMMIAENCTLDELPKDKETKKERFFTNPLTDFYKHIRRKYKLWCYIWQCLFKRPAIENLRFADTLRIGGEDNLFMFDAVAKIKNFVQIDDIVACHRYSKSSATLNNYNPKMFFQICEVYIPYAYQNYTLKNVDKRLFSWAYHKISYGVYRFFVRNMFRKNVDSQYFKQSKEILLKYYGKPEFKEIYNRWNLRQKIFFKLFINEKYNILKKLKFFM